MRKKTWERKEIITLPPSYIRAPGSTCTTSLVVIHKGVEVIVVWVGSPISIASSWLSKRVDWAVIDHMPGGVTSSADPKIAGLIRVSPLMTEITPGCQTMMCRMTGRRFPAGRTGVHGAGESMVTEIRATVTLGVGGVRARVLDENSRGGRGDPLPVGDLNADDFIISYWGGSRWRGAWWDLKGQGKGRRGGVDSGLSAVVLLLSSGEGEVDLLKGWVKDFAREFLQVAVEGIGVE